MALIHGFRSTTIWKAFILNSISYSLAIIVTIYVKSYFDVFTYIKVKNKNGEIRRKISLIGFLATFISAFATTFIAYVIMYYTFGFGEALMVSEET